MTAMNRVYFSDLMVDVRDQQALKLQSLGMDMALQAEELRSSLFDWHRQVLGLLMSTDLDASHVPTIARTNFGLWVFHKGDLLFQDSEEISRLKKSVVQIDNAFENALQIRSDGWGNKLRVALENIDQQVTVATTILTTMSQKTMAMEGGRDPLTKLFNRRFLRTILQREVRASISTQERFAIIMVDLDYFKKVNDKHGHDAGDAVLEQFAELMLNTVRAGDFVFRYGGEEFLVVLNSVTDDSSLMVANKIRETVESHDFQIGEGLDISLTVSIGIAVHDGHPDYNNLISQSDAAVYQAKKAGRNQVHFYSKFEDNEVATGH